MWRAEVVANHSPGWVSVTIPALYGSHTIGPIQSAVDPIAGARVVVADLNPDVRLRDWWVIGYESTIGRWGSPYPHTHPIGQVDGLNDALAAKADTTVLEGYATTTAVESGLAVKADTTALESGLAAKADVAGAWVDCAMTAVLAPDDPGAPSLAVRTTPFGLQLRGACRAPAAAARDVLAFTLPAGYAPSYATYLNVPTMGPSSTDFAATYRQFQLNPDRTVTTREPLVNGDRMSFNHTLLY